jgi:hypothetical protein
MPTQEIPIVGTIEWIPSLLVHPVPEEPDSKQQASRYGSVQSGLRYRFPRSPLVPPRTLEVEHILKRVDGSADKCAS